jgi:site-specific DNA recombinase
MKPKDSRPADLVSANGHSVVSGANGKRAILYVRVSTDEQAEHGYSLPTQLEACQKYAAKQGFSVPGPEYEITDDYSGAKLDRPGLDRARAMLEAGEAEAIIVYSPDRLTRNLAHSLILREGFQRAGVELHYCNRGKSEDTAESRMTENMEAVFGDYWREKIMESSKRGRRAKAASGKWVGGGPPPFGYRAVGKGRETHLEIDPTEAAIVRRIYSLYLGSPDRTPLSGTKIAELLQSEGVSTPGRSPDNTARGKVNTKGWGSDAVLRMLQRRAYVGEFTYAEHVIQLPDLAIVDWETWKRAQAQIANNTNLSPRNCKNEYLLRGRLRCTCGGPMMARTSYSHRVTPLRRYYCQRQAREKHMTQCLDKSVPGARADGLVWGWLTEVFSDPNKLKAGLTDYAKQQSAELKEKRERWEIMDSLIRQADGSVKQLARDLHELGKSKDMEAARTAVKAELQSASRQVAALTKEQNELTAELASVEMSAERQALILAWATELREGFGNGDVGFEAMRRSVDLLDVQAKIEYRKGTRGIFMRCILRGEVKWEELPVGKRGKRSNPSGNRASNSAHAPTLRGNSAVPTLPESVEIATHSQRCSPARPSPPADPARPGRNLPRSPARSTPETQWSRHPASAT